MRTSDGRRKHLTALWKKARINIQEETWKHTRDLSENQL